MEQPAAKNGGGQQRLKIVCIGEARSSYKSEILRRYLRSNAALKQKLFGNAPAEGSTTATLAPPTTTTSITNTTDAHKNVVFEGDVAAAEGSAKAVPVAVEIVDAAPEEHNRLFAYPRTDLFLIFFSIDDHEAQKHLLTRVPPPPRHFFIFIYFTLGQRKKNKFA
jgi:hypothetical protein